MLSAILNKFIMNYLTTDYTLSMDAKFFFLFLPII